VGLVAHMGEARNSNNILVSKTEGKRPLGRRKHRWEDNIKIVSLRSGGGAFLNMIMNPQFPQKAGNFLTSSVTINFSRRILFHGVNMLVS
jgi:hypothetical protein